MSESVLGLLKEIQETRTQKSASSKDENRVMRAMLNDKTYEVGIYGKNGQEGTVSPAREAREMISSVISSTTKIATGEADALADAYEFKKSEANNFINISKEFVNTYMGTGRKLPLGGRALSDVSLIEKEVAAGTRTYPTVVGIDENGKKITGTGTKEVPAHTSIKVISPCPSWVK